MTANAVTQSDAYTAGLALSEDGLHLEAIAQFEQALREKPDDIRVLFALGNTARALGLVQAAGEFYHRVLALDPHRIEALVNLANLLRGQEQFSAVEALLTPAITLNPQSPELWLTLGSAYRELGDYERAAIHFRQALFHRPNYVAALSNLADLLDDEQRRDEALELYDRAIALEPGNAQVRLNRAMLHFANGNLKDGWRDYAARVKIPGKVPVPDIKLPKWNGSSLKNTRLLITAEQGIGDQVMFAGMIPELVTQANSEGGTIILECESRLVSLFARSFPGAVVHAWDIVSKNDWTHARYGWLESAGGADAMIEMGSLPGLLRPRLEDFPTTTAFLKPDAADKLRWSGFLKDAASGPFIGVCWRSGKTVGGRALEYAPLEKWAAFIARLPGTAVCIQYDAREDELATLERLAGRKILVPPNLDQKNDLDQTSALLSALDAVVSAPTAVSWLAASAGIKTYKLLYITSWTMFGQTYEPFAPSCLSMKPKSRGDWSSNFDETISQLTARL